MTLEEFAALHKARIRRDSCGDLIIPGRPAKAARHEDRNHIFADAHQFGVSLVCSTARRFNARVQKLLAAGFVFKQRGDTEGLLFFDSSDDVQSRLALEICGVRKIRPATEEQRATARMRFRRPSAADLPSVGVHLPSDQENA